MPYIIDNITADTVNVTETLKINGEEIGPKYKVYTALLNQSGTDAPVATVLENTLGGDVVWTRNAEGDYIGTLINAFPSNKTTSFIQQVANAYLTTTGWANNDSVFIYVSNFDNSNGVDFLSKTPIEIRVYN